MGGKALKNVKISRISLYEYNRIREELIYECNNEGITCGVPHEVPGKVDFGDIDVLVVANGKDIKRWIIEKFAPREIVTNDTVISFSYASGEKFFQIDFIKVVNLGTAMLFFSYGDVGAIICKYSGFHGITFSEDGIIIKIRGDLVDEEDKEHVHRKVHITADPDTVCNMLGLSYTKWRNGFNSIEHIYNWICSSPYFRQEIFQFMNMEKRKCVGMRPFYINFLKSIGIDPDNISNINNKINNSNRANMQLRILEDHNKLHIIDEIKTELDLERKRREKFNGHIFLGFGAEQKHLGLTISDFKKCVANKHGVTFETWLDLLTKEQIREEIGQFVLSELEDDI
jgi:hypothetical protein